MWEGQRVLVRLACCLCALVVAGAGLRTTLAFQDDPDAASPTQSVVQLSARCAALDSGRLVAIYDPANPDPAWSDVLAAHDASVFNPLVARSGLRSRGTALTYALWVQRASQADPPVFDTAEARSL